MKKFTLLTFMLLTCAMSFAQTEITSPEEIQPGKIYWFENGQYKAWFEMDNATIYFDETFGDRICLTYFSTVAEGHTPVADDPNDPKQQFAFINYKDKLYLYSVGADNFVCMQNKGVYVMDNPINHVSVTTNTCTSIDGYPMNIRFDNDWLMGVYANNAHYDRGYLDCDVRDPSERSYAWKICEVGEMTNLDEVTARLVAAMEGQKGVIELAQDSLLYTCDMVEEFFSKINYSVTGGEVIGLQCTDPDAANYIWCNEPELSEGSIEGLLDDNDETFFHSCWNGTVEYVHWLQVDLGTEIKDFQFNYKTRHNAQNNFPTGIEVLGSNDGEYFELIAAYNEGLPYGKSLTWKSGNIKADQSYKHLRFVFMAENVFWHLAKFELKQEEFVDIDIDYLPYLSYIEELLETVNAAKTFLNENQDAKPEAYYAYVEDINAKLEFIKKIASGEPDDETIAYISTVEQLLALEGIGYPAEAPRAELNAAVEVAKSNPTTQARFDLEKAVQSYIETTDITLPVDGKKYTLTFVFPTGHRNFINYESYGEFGGYTFSLLRDNYTANGLSLPETAVFTCVDNLDGTFDFMTHDYKYLTTPESGSVSGSEVGISEYKTYFYIVKMYPNEFCNSNITYKELLGLVALSNAGTFMAPTQSGEYIYLDDLPNYTNSWSSAMKIEPYESEDTGIDAVNAASDANTAYDLQGRKVANPTVGLYIINGKKMLLK